MKTLILYASGHGAVKKAATRLAEILGETTLVDLKKERTVNLKRFDTVILGGSIYAGMIQRKVRTFMAKNEAVLLKKRLGLFLCCLFEGETAREQFEASFPPALKAHAAATGLFGGEFDYDKLNFFEKAVVQKVAGKPVSVSKLRMESIEEFAKKLTRTA
jgi:menaquinone-dependent protoporphyrinogen oxidase